MSFLSKLFGARAGGCKTSSRQAGDRVYVVDATGMVDPRQRSNGGQASPRDHFAILRMLSQFAEREGLEIQAVFTGRPLREASDGQEFKGVRVFYAENSEGAQARIKELIGKLAARKDVVLFAADTVLEREAGELGAVCMRLSTLRKSCEERDDRDDRGEHGDRDRGDRDRGNRDRGNRDRGNRDRGNRDRGDRDRQHFANNNRNPASEPQAEPAEPSEPREKENPSVLDLIDPV